jgi:hypothetical protein
MCRCLEFSKRGKKFQALRKFCKKAFFWEKIFGKLLDARDITIFEISIQFRFFSCPFRPILKKIISTLLRDSINFLEVKRSNEIETVQNLKKPLFYKLVLGVASAAMRNQPHIYFSNVRGWHNRSGLFCLKWLWVTWIRAGLERSGAYMPITLYTT